MVCSIPRTQLCRPFPFNWAEIKSKHPYLSLSRLVAVLFLFPPWSSIFVCGCPAITMATWFAGYIQVSYCNWKMMQKVLKYAAVIKLHGAAQIVRHRAYEIWRNLIIKIGQLGLITKPCGIQVLLLHFQIHKDYGYSQLGGIPFVVEISGKSLHWISQSIT